MTKPDLTKYTDDRLATYHLFVLRSRTANGVTPKGGMAYLREARRVERELARRMELAGIARSTPHLSHCDSGGGRSGRPVMATQTSIEATTDGSA